MRARKVFEGSKIEGEIAYSDGTTASYSGQTNHTALMRVDGEPVGRVDYVLFRGGLTVSDIQVRPGWRRRGVGSRLMKYVRQENPGHRYEPSMKTPDGAAFVHRDVELYESYDSGLDFYDESDRLRDFDDVLSDMKGELYGAWEHYTPKIKRRLIRRLSQYWHRERERSE